MIRVTYKVAGSNHIAHHDLHNKWLGLGLKLGSGGQKLGV
jgi:hypothetical protein